MKLLKMCSFLMLLILFCTTYADENKYIFIGKNGNGESAKPAFILEVSAEDANSVFALSEGGEIHLKADQIVLLPKEALTNFSNEPVGESALAIDSGRNAGYCQRGHDLCTRCGLCHNTKCWYYVKPCWER